MIERLRWVTHAILPLVYDESLSYVELLNKVIAKLNEVIDKNNNLSENTKGVVAEWLNTEDGKNSIKSIVGDFITEYSQTPDFQNIIVNSIESMGDLEASVNTAINSYLNSVQGKTVIGDTTKGFLVDYTKTDEFKTLVSDAFSEIANILRGTTLNIKQRSTARIWSEYADINSCDMDSDYSVNEIYSSITASKNGINLAYNKFGNSLKIDGSGVRINCDTNVGGNKITNIKTPTDAKDAATKGYVDSKYNTRGNGTTYLDVTYTENDGTYHLHKTFDEIIAMCPAVALIYDGIVYRATDYNGQRIIFTAKITTDVNDINYTFTYNNESILQYAEVIRNDNSNVKTNGSSIMSGNLKMGGNKVVNIGDGTDNGDAVNVKILKKTVGKNFTGNTNTWSNGAIGSTITGLSFDEISAAVRVNPNVTIEITPGDKENATVLFHFAGWNIDPTWDIGQTAMVFKGCTFDLGAKSYYTIFLIIGSNGIIKKTTFNGTFAL